MSPASLRTGTSVGPDQDYRPAPSGSAVRVSDALTVLPAQRDARSHHTNAAQAQLAPPPHSPAAADSAVSAALPTPSSSAPGPAIRNARTQPTSAPGAQALRTPSSTRNAAIMAAGTSLSRVTGFARASPSAGCLARQVGRRLQPGQHHPQHGLRPPLGRRALGHLAPGPDAVFDVAPRPATRKRSLRLSRS